MTINFAAAEAARLEPPEERWGVCYCGCSEENHHAEDGWCGWCPDCNDYREYTAEDARWDAESEAGDAARKERDL